MKPLIAVFLVGALGLSGCAGSPKKRVRDRMDAALREMPAMPGEAEFERLHTP